MNGQMETELKTARLFWKQNKRKKQARSNNVPPKQSSSKTIKLSEKIKYITLTAICKLCIKIQTINFTEFLMPVINYNVRKT